MRRNKKCVGFAVTSDDNTPILVCEGETGDKKGLVKVEVPVDSGAADNVMPPDMSPSVKIQPSEKSRQNGTYTVANGKKIANLGEKSARFRTDANKNNGITLQITGVRRPLISASRLRKKRDTTCC